MVTNAMKLPISLTITESHYEELIQHLFPGDQDEHGAVLTAGIVETPRGTRLLVKDVFLAQDGLDYVPGTRGYRALTAQFVAEKAGYCDEQKLAYLAVHCHGGSNRVAFSSDDLASHERGYPAILDITRGGPVGALVFAKNAVAGDIWTPRGRYPLHRITIIGSHIQTLYPEPPKNDWGVDLKYDRHARLFGEAGQYILSNLKVGIVGLGGGGSILNELLSRLGVGHIVAVDFDRVDITNLPRIVGATSLDAMAPLAKNANPKLREFATRLSKYKVDVAERVAKRANPNIIFDPIIGNIVDEKTAHKLIDVDFLFLATDSIQSRVVFNAILHQYLIPGAQIGVKILTDKNQLIDQVQAASRIILPFYGGGCLDCNRLIPAHRLALEALSGQERHAQRYIDTEDVPEPSVITLNAITAARVANDFMMMFTGLFGKDVELNHLMEFANDREIHNTIHITNSQCLDCSNAYSSRRARGDRARLPCRQA